MLLGRQVVVVHEEETRPLHANLGDAEEAGTAAEGRIDFATGHVLAAGGKGEDIGYSACSGNGTKEDPVGGEAFRGAAGDYTVVLWEVGEDETEENEAVMSEFVSYCQFLIQCVQGLLDGALEREWLLGSGVWGLGSGDVQRDEEVGYVWGGELLAAGIVDCIEGLHFVGGLSKLGLGGVGRSVECRV